MHIRISSAGNASLLIQTPPPPSHEGSPQQPVSHTKQYTYCRLFSSGKFSSCWRCSEQESHAKHATTALLQVRYWSPVVFRSIRGVSDIFMLLMARSTTNLYDTNSNPHHNHTSTHQNSALKRNNAYATCLSFLLALNPSISFCFHAYFLSAQSIR